MAAVTGTGLVSCPRLHGVLASVPKHLVSHVPADIHIVVAEADADDGADVPPAAPARVPQQLPSL
jgi:hypothetical protein